jgi:hypothetical protein
MQQNEQFQKLVIALRVAYWFVVAGIVTVIYATPDRPLPAGAPHAQDVFYFVLLTVSIADVAAAAFMDRLAYRAATSNEPPQTGSSMPKPKVMPVILWAFGISTAIYGLVYRLIGGSTTRSLSFLVFTFIGYIIFSLATIRYAALLGRDVSSPDS